MSYADGNMNYGGGNNFGPYIVTTTGTAMAGTTWVSPNTSVASPAMPMQVGGAPVVAEDEMAWLRRRVSEVTDMVAA